MAVALDNRQLIGLHYSLKNGEYDGVEIMQAWLAIDELIELRNWQDKVLKSYPSIENEIAVEPYNSERELRGGEE